MIYDEEESRHDFSSEEGRSDITVDYAIHDDDAKKWIRARKNRRKNRLRVTLTICVTTMLKNNQEKSPGKERARDCSAIHPM